MNQKERLTVSRGRARALAQASADRGAMFVGGYLAGRFARNSKVGEYPMPLVAGLIGFAGMRRARSMGGQGARLGMAGLIGGGCYGAGKLGEEHGIKAKNDGNLFSWGKKQGSDKNEFYTD